MLETFGIAIGAGKQIKKATEIFKINEKENSGYNNVDEIEAFLKEVSPIIHKDIGQNDFRSDRLNKDLRKMTGYFKAELQ